MIIHFLYTFDFLCNGPNTVTPIMPLIIGLPPTTIVAKGRISLLKNGSIKNDNVIAIALNIPKAHPKAANNNKKFLFLNNLDIATLNGYLFIDPASDGGVGGLFFWNMIFGNSNTAVIKASRAIN